MKLSDKYTGVKSTICISQMLWEKVSSEYIMCTSAQLISKCTVLLTTTAQLFRMRFGVEQRHLLVKQHEGLLRHVNAPVTSSVERQSHLQELRHGQSG